MLLPQVYETGEMVPDGIVAGAPRAHARSTPIAVIGYAGRFPRSENAAQFWHNLEQGIDCVGEIPADRWDATACFDKRPATALHTYCNQGGFLKRIDHFDHDFFGISEDEARLMDPKQRLMIETAYHGLEHAGYGGEAFCGPDTGVFIGSSYYHHEHEMPAERVISPFGMLGTSNTLLANRISYMFDFQGPSCFVDTFCSSSLLAVHLACQSLGRGECRTALAGGVHLLSLIHYISLSQFRALSPTGRCRAFDDAADGFVPGEGVGIVVLKPLSAALADGDSIHAVIRGAAVNHTGRTHTLTSPNAASQRRLIEAAYADAGIDFASIGYIETHGTGTRLGDPLEIKALHEAFAKNAPSGAKCVLGSVKASIGHLEPASGIAGLIKVLLCLRHKKIPGVLHLNRMNRFINLDRSPFTINSETIDWKCPHGLRRAGISSFGLSGTDVHMVVEAPPEKAEGSRAVPEAIRHVYPLSARSHAALRRLAGETAGMLDQYTDKALGDLCFTQAVGRRHFAWRAALPCRSTGELKERLSALSAADRSATPAGDTLVRQANQSHSMAMVFGDPPDDGWTGLRDLCQYPLFRRVFNESMAEIRRWPRQPAGKHRPGRRCLAGRAGQNRHHQHLAVCQAVFRLLGSFGLVPEWVTGHGTGKIAAALAVDAIGWKTALAALAQWADGPNDEAVLTVASAPTIPLVSDSGRAPDHRLGPGDRMDLGASPVGATARGNGEAAPDAPFSMLTIGDTGPGDPAVSLPLGADPVSLCARDGAIDAGLSAALGRLYAHGASIDWSRVYQAARPSRLPLPVYPFEARPLRFGKNRGPAIMDLLLNRGQPDPAPPEETAVPGPMAARTGPPEAADALFEGLAAMVARKTGVARETLASDTPFDAIGLDSIMKVELSYDIMARHPTLEQAGDALIQAETLGGFVAIIRGLLDESPEHGLENRVRPEPVATVDSLHHGQKRDPQNLTSRACQAADREMTADLVVDEGHPFFFDHPLDHISGLHQLEAMAQVATTAHCHLEPLAAGSPLFFRDVHVDFNHLCSKTAPARIHARRLDFREGCGDAGFYTTRIDDGKRTCCQASFKIQDLASAGWSGARPADRPPRDGIAFVACEGASVHKRQDANVLIGEALSPKAGDPEMVFRLRPVGDHPYFGDFPGDHVPSIYFMEAFRQTQRYQQHFQAAGTEPETAYAGFLISLSLSLYRPVNRFEAVSISVEPVEPKPLGERMLIAASGRLHIDRVTVGLCRAKSLLQMQKRQPAGAARGAPGRILEEGGWR